MGRESARGSSSCTQVFFFDIHSKKRNYIGLLNARPVPSEWLCLWEYPPLKLQGKHIYVYTYVHMCMQHILCTHIHVCVCVCVCMHVYMCVYMCTYMYTCTYVAHEGKLCTPRQKHLGNTLCCLDDKFDRTQYFWERS